MKRKLVKSSKVEYKTFDEVKIGDIAIDHNDEKSKVIDKGTLEEMCDSYGHYSISDYGMEEFAEDDAIAVKYGNGSEIPWLYDDSGALVKKSELSNSRKSIKSAYSDTEGATYKAKGVVKQMVKQFGYDSTKQAFDEAFSTIKSSKKKAIKSAPQRATLNPEEIMRFDEDDYSAGSVRPFDKMLRRTAEADVAEEKEKERQALREKYADVVALLDSGKEPEKVIEDLFEELVPASGNAETVAGEMVRACMKVMYRLYNDGDCFLTGENPGDGTGAATVVPSLTYLVEQIPELNSMIEKMVYNYSDYIKQDYSYQGGSTRVQFETTPAYDEWVNNTLPQLVIDTLKNNPDLFGETNTEDSTDYDYDPKEWGPSDLDYEIDASNDYRKIPEDSSERELERDIESDLDWMSFLSDTEISVDVEDRDSYVESRVTINGLTFAQLQQCFEELPDSWLYDEVENLTEEADDEDDDYDEDESDED